MTHDPRCLCGHTRSEHDESGKCQANDMNIWLKRCPCTTFRAEPEAA